MRSIQQIIANAAGVAERINKTETASKKYMIHHQLPPEIKKMTLLQGVK